MNEASATATHSIVVERVMPHPPEKIWRALTQGPLIEEWLMKNDFQPVVGHQFNFRADPMPDWNGVTDCEVLIVEPNKRLSYTLERFGRRGGERIKDRRHLDAEACQRRHARCAWSNQASARKTSTSIGAQVLAGRRWSRPSNR